MSDPTFADIDFNNKMAWAWTTLKQFQCKQSHILSYQNNQDKLVALVLWFLLHILHDRTFLILRWDGFSWLFLKLMALVISNYLSVEFLVASCKRLRLKPFWKLPIDSLYLNATFVKKSISSGSWNLEYFFIRRNSSSISTINRKTNNPIVLSKITKSKL